MIQKLRMVLAKPKLQRRLLDNGFLWIVGKIIRKVQNVDELLAPTRSKRALPLPAKGRLLSNVTKNISTTIDNVMLLVLVAAMTNHQLELLTFPQSSSCERVELLLDVLGLSIYKNLNRHKRKRA